MTRHSFMDAQIERSTQGAVKATRSSFEQWRNAHPKGATNRAGHLWTGEVSEEGQALWFVYKDTEGRLYDSQEVPAIRIDLRDAQYIAIPESKAHLGLCAECAKEERGQS